MKNKWMPIVLYSVFLSSEAGATNEAFFDEAIPPAPHPGVAVLCPSNTTRVLLEVCPDLATPDWEARAVQRLPDEHDGTAFSFTPPVSTTALTLARCAAVATNALPSRRLRMLHNGYFLTVDPNRVLGLFSYEDRHRLYVLHSLLIDPDTGRIAAIFPPFDGDGMGGAYTAMPANVYAQLTNECPASPHLPSSQVIDWWRSAGVAENLLTNLDIVDLNGAVCTPGIIDGHFHITSWSKKLPDEGEMFGFYADVSDPVYYIDPATGDRYTTDASLSRVVSNANIYLAGNTRTGIFLHGFVNSSVETLSTNEDFQESFVYNRNAAGCGAVAPGTNYQLNNIVRGAEAQPAVLVHTSGQMCWVNAELIDRFNRAMGWLYSNRFAETSVTMVTPPEPDASLWTFQVGPPPPSGNDLFDGTPPFTVDLIVDSGAGFDAPAWIPFELTVLSNGTRTAYGIPMREDMSDRLTGTVSVASFVPCCRFIPTCIPTGVWNAAYDFFDAPPEIDGKAYGQWDPRAPYDSNWYNGAERGLMEYFFDEDGSVWRPSGYAEHYAMRDILSSVVIGIPSAEENMRFRRNLARWCHRHGITGIQDIMFYRRRTNPEEFHCYEGLSYERSPSDDPDFFNDRGISTNARTGHFNLRVGAYYYLEKLEQVEDVLALAGGTNAVTDRDRLCPPPDHPEYPGWVHWTGWKLQLDGGTGARTFYSAAPVAKPFAGDPYETVNEDGSNVTFQAHGYGLLTMTDDQPQTFDSRQTAALYWLARESDPHHPNFNPSLVYDWTVLKNGVAEWIGEEINETNLAEDLRVLSHVDMTITNTPPYDEAAMLAAKLRLAYRQVNSGYSNTLQTIARIWYEKSVAAGSGKPVAHQVACHCIGDAGVEIWLRVIRQLCQDVANLTTNQADLPDHWKRALPDNPDLIAIHRGFTNERYRIEHLLNFTPHAVSLLRNAVDGIDKGTFPWSRNVVFSTQPSLLATDGQAFRAIGFPAEQELWPIPYGAASNFWRNLPAIPRYDHHMACPLYMDYDIPFALNTDPPSVRDPRPAITVLAAVSRCPIEADPGNWLDQTGDTPDYRPPDYLIGKVYPPLGLMAGFTNPMQMTVEQTLTHMTFWSAYNAHLEYDQGVLAAPWSVSASNGWYADLVIWENNPLAIRSEDGNSLHDLGRLYYVAATNERNNVVNSWIEKFRPSVTVVGGAPVYVAPIGKERWQGILH